MEYSKEVKKLLKAIKDKQEENKESEKKKTDLEEDVTRREKCIEPEEPNVKETFRGTRKLWEKVGRRY